MVGDDGTRDIRTRPSPPPPPLSLSLFLLGFYVFDCYASCVLYTADWGERGRWMENFCFRPSLFKIPFFLLFFYLSCCIEFFFFFLIS